MGVPEAVSHPQWLPRPQSDLISSEFNFSVKYMPCLPELTMHTPMLATSYSEKEANFSGKNTVWDPGKLGRWEVDTEGGQRPEFAFVF